MGRGERGTLKMIDLALGAEATVINSIDSLPSGAQVRVGQGANVLYLQVVKSMVETIRPGSHTPL